MHVTHRDFDEAMFFLRDAFGLEHPDIQGRATADTKAYKDTYERLRKATERQVQQRPGDNAAELMQLLAKTDRSLDWWAWQQKINKVEATDPALAEQLYREAIAALPEAHQLIGNFANFMKNVRQDHDEAERLYRRALEVEPDHTTNLGNFANFMTDIRQDHDEAERLYRRALEVEPDHANNLGNFAVFMKNIRQDHDEAERLYRRALEVAPDHASTLGNFANFMKNIRQDHDEAERRYRRALDVEPDRANTLGNFAQWLLAHGRREEGFTHLARAESLAEQPLLRLELAYYRYAHGPDAGHREAGLRTCRRLILAGTRSPGWRLAANVTRAVEDGHPEGEFLAALAAVIADEQGGETLESFKAWKDAGDDS